MAACSETFSDYLEATFPKSAKRNRSGAISREFSLRLVCPPSKKCNHGVFVIQPARLAAG